MATNAGSGLDNLNFDGFKVAQVMENYDKDGEGKLQVYIPSIQYENKYNETVNDSKTTVKNKVLKNKNKDKKFTGGKVVSSNYITARPLTPFLDERSNKDNKSGQYRIPMKKSTVIVIFLDSDPQKCYYLPWNPTSEGDVMGDRNVNYPKDWNKNKYKERINIASDMFPNGTRIDVNWNDDHSTFTVTVQPTTGKKMIFQLHENGLATINGSEIVTDANFLKYLRKYHPVGWRCV
jgi:hypothetical protein